MSRSAVSGVFISLRRRMNRAFKSPQIAFLLPAVCYVAYRLWGESGLLTVALLAPAALILAQTVLPPLSEVRLRRGPARRPDIEAALQRAVDTARDTGYVTVAYAISIDEFAETRKRIGPRGMDAVQHRVGERLRAAMRTGDLHAYLDGGVFAIALDPVPRMELETMLQLAARLQAAVIEPILVDGLVLRPSATIGFCHSERVPQASGGAILEAAEAALEEAQQHGPGSIRAYSVDLHKRRTKIHKLRGKTAEALEHGGFRAWFQPQVSTDTGRLTGFEALARWPQDDGTTIAPPDFLSAIAEAGLMDRLGETMLVECLTALRAWDRAGVEVPTVGLNLSETELRNPTLLDRVSWELDRFGISAERLTIEVLESVIADAPEDMVCRNINGLAKLGCRIDLDDFGTGSASITSIRRFHVNRIKVDRSFVRGIDQDRSQQQMMAAILTMAEPLELETLAEGVETLAEHAMLGQLGCGHVQGYIVGKPMPYEETIDWMARHDQKLALAIQTGRSLGSA
ncbi:MAG: GGDEF domain-containing phosphodiesterase [Pseudomonadota bacterium]